MSAEGKSLPHRLRTIGLWSGIVGAVGLAMSAAGVAREPAALFPGYLFAFTFWLNLSLGALAILMVHYQVGGSWGFMTRRILEAAASVLPALLVLFVPLLFGLRELYPWARGEGDPHLLHLRSYLNPGFFAVRAAVYFGVWISCAWLLIRWSTLADRSPDPALWDRRRRLSGVGLLLFAVTTYFASVDWVMSIEPRWSSTIYGMLFISGQALAGFALITTVVVFLSKEEPLRTLATGSRLIDLGNLLLTTVMLWAYLSFSQYLIIWSENLPREIPWVARRTEPGWRILALGLLIFHFAVPFFLLLFRAVKSRGLWIAALAAVLLVLRMADDYWRILPAFHSGGPALHWTHAAALAGIGGVWVSVFTTSLAARPLLPLNDPRFQPALEEVRVHG